MASEAVGSGSIPLGTTRVTINVMVLAWQFRSARLRGQRRFSNSEDAPPHASGCVGETRSIRTSKRSIRAIHGQTFDDSGDVSSV